MTEGRLEALLIAAVERVLLIGLGHWPCGTLCTIIWSKMLLFWH